MIQLIRYIILLLLFSLFVYADNQIFEFYKAFPICKDPLSKQDVYAYTQAEANNLYKTKIISINKNKCKSEDYIFQDEDAEYYNEATQVYGKKAIGITEHFYSLCIQKKLHFKLANKSLEVCKTKYKWPFNKVVIIDNKYLIILANSFYFVFKKTPLNNIKYYVHDLNKMLKVLKENSLEKTQYFDLALIQNTIEKFPISPKTLTTYNNIAYYLQKAGANEEAVYLLEKIIKKFPNRTVAYYNLGDAYWALGKKQKAIKAYTTYIEQMCDKGLQKKIPKVVLKRIEIKK